MKKIKLIFGHIKERAWDSAFKLYLVQIIVKKSLFHQGD